MKRCPQCFYVYKAIDWNCPSCRFNPPRLLGFPVLTPGIVEGAGFKPEVYAELVTLEANNFWFRARNKLIIWVLRRYFPHMDRYLEIGCGTGYVLAGLAQVYPKARISGSELFSVGLSYAQSRVPGAELFQMDACRIPYQEEFDVIGAFDVLEHIVEDELVLTEMFRALRPGGGIAITVPQHPKLWSRRDEYACHVRRYGIGELQNKVQRSGFRVEFETSFVSLLLPAMIMARRVRRNATVEGEAMAELRLPLIINRAFEMVMNVERLLIRWGMRFPIGGSLLLVARKPKGIAD